MIQYQLTLFNKPKGKKELERFGEWLKDIQEQVNDNKLNKSRTFPFQWTFRQDVLLIKLLNKK